jgi:DNA-binding CsgD family transcriptional regulator
VGKTRLAAEYAAEAAGKGAAVLYGRCDWEAPVPYGPIVEALDHPVTLTAAQKLPSEQRAGLIPLMGRLRVPGPPRARTDDEELARLRMFDAVLACLSQAAARQPIVLVLDDLHWAPPSTLALVTHLVTRRSGAAIIPLLTARDSDRDQGGLTTGPLADLRHRQVLHTVRLGGLARTAIAELIADWTGQSPAETLVDDLLAYTRGNPFYLRATLRHLGAAGRLVGPGGEVRQRLADDAGRLPVPDDLRETISTLLEPLGGTASSLLTAASVLGAEFALDEAAAAAGLSAEQAVQALDACSRVGLVRQREGTPVRAHFEHALVQQALREALSPARRALVSRRAAEAIEAAGVPAARCGELAARFAEAMSLGTAARTLHWARRAAAEAARRYAFDAEGSSLELALRAIEAGAANDPWEEYEVLMALGAARYRAAQLPAAQAAFASAAELAERLGDPDRVARAALGPGMERYRHGLGPGDGAAIGLLTQGLRALDGRPHLLGVRLSTSLAIERWFLDSLDVQRERIDAAIAMARAIGDLDGEIEARTVRQVVLWTAPNTPELLAEAPALLTLANARGRLDLTMHLHSASLGQALELGRRAEVGRHLAGAAAAVDRLRTAIQQVRLDALMILVSLVDGRLDEAAGAISATVPVMAEIEPATAAQLHLLWRLMLARQRGSLVELRPDLEAFAGAVPDLPLAQALLGEVYAEAGELARAREQLGRVGRTGFATVHDDFNWLAVLSCAGRIAAQVGDLDAAHRLYELLAPYEDRFCLAGVATAGPPVGDTLGLLAAARGETNAAIAHLTAARDRARAFGARPWEAQSALGLGRVLRRAGSRRAAREPLAAALTLAEACGAEPLAARAHEELRAAGGRARRPAHHSELTAAERRVATLAAGGASNDQIARALFVSRRTVETHLTHAYRKLGISSRVELGEGLTTATQASHDEPAAEVTTSPG